MQKIEIELLEYLDVLVEYVLRCFLLSTSDKVDYDSHLRQMEMRKRDRKKDMGLKATIIPETHIKEF